MSAHSSHSARFEARYRSLSAGASGRPDTGSVTSSAARSFAETNAGGPAGLPLRRGDGVQQPAGRLGHVVDRFVERLGVGPRRHAVAAHLAHVLQRGLLDLPVGGRLVGPAEDLDAPAHGPEHARPRAQLPPTRCPASPIPGISGRPGRPWFQRIPPRCRYPCLPGAGRSGRKNASIATPPMPANTRRSRPMPALHRNHAHRAALVVGPAAVARSVRSTGGALAAGPDGTIRAFARPATTSPQTVCSPIWFTAVALGWNQEGSATPVAASLAAGRSRAAFEAAQTADSEPAEGPGPGTPDYHPERQDTELVWTGGSRCVRFTLTVPARTALSGLHAAFVNTSGSARGPGTAPPQESVQPTPSVAGFGLTAAEAMPARPPMVTRAG